MTHGQIRDRVLSIAKSAGVDPANDIGLFGLFCLCIDCINNAANKKKYTKDESWAALLKAECTEVVKSHTYSALIDQVIFQHDSSEFTNNIYQLAQLIRKNKLQTLPFMQIVTPYMAIQMIPYFKLCAQPSFSFNINMARYIMLFIHMRTTQGFNLHEKYCEYDQSNLGGYAELTEAQFIQLSSALFLINTRPKPVKSNELLTDLFNAYRNNNELDQLLEDYYYIITDKNGFRDYRGDKKKLLLKADSYKMWDILPADFLNFKYFRNPSDVAFEYSLILEKFYEISYIAKSKTYASMLVIHPSPDFVIDIINRLPETAKITFAIPNIQVLELLQHQFAESKAEFISISDLHADGSYDRVLFFARKLRDDIIISVFKKVFNVEFVSPEAKLLVFTPNKYSNTIKPLFYKKGFQLLSVVEVPPIPTMYKPYAGSLYTLEASNIPNSSVCLYKAFGIPTGDIWSFGIDRKHRIINPDSLFFDEDSIFSNSPIHDEDENGQPSKQNPPKAYDSSRSTHNEEENSQPSKQNPPKACDSSCDTNGKDKNVQKLKRNPPKTYDFSREIKVVYTIQQRGFYHVGKAYYCEIRDKKDRRQVHGKRMSKSVEKGLRDEKQESVIEKLEFVAFDDRIRPSIITDIKAKYAQSLSELSLKTVWFCCRDELSNARNYSDTTAREIFCGKIQPLSDICISASTECFDQAFTAFFDSRINGVQVKYVEQVYQILQVASRLGYCDGSDQFYPLLQAYSNRATKQQNQVRNDLSKKTFTSLEENRMLSACFERVNSSESDSKYPKYVVESTSLAWVIMFYTGMAVREVCALQWSDFVKIENMDTYQLLITKFLSQESKPTPGNVDDWKRYRRIPLVKVLSNMLLERKQYLVGTKKIPEDQLMKCPIVLASENNNEQFCSLVKAKEAFRKILMAAEIPENIIKMPDDDSGRLTDLNKNYGSIYTTNFRYHAKHNARLMRGEINCILGLDPPDTFSKYYFDFSNDIVQMMISKKLDRWASRHDIPPNQATHSSSIQRMTSRSVRNISIDPDGGSTANATINIGAYDANSIGFVSADITCDIGCDVDLIKYDKE